MPGIVLPGAKVKILVNGASNSRGPGTWPYYLQDNLGCELVNLALANAGSTYVHETTITELSQRQYNLVLVMWPTLGRIDLRVADIDKYSDSTRTSLYQSKQNDWPEKIVEPVNDQDYVQKDWIFSTGFANATDSTSAFLNEYHNITNHTQLYHSEMIRIISTQAFLKTANIPYLFMFWKPFKKFSRFESLYKLIDWDNFYLDDDLQSIGQRNNWIDQDQLHLNPRAHEYYASLILNRLNLKQ